MQRSKIESYLGFAKKSGNLRAGVNAIAALRSADLLIICASASENTKKEAMKLAAKFGCPLIESKIPAEKLAGKENCKLLAVTEKNLARAVSDNIDENFTIKTGGCK